jgi:hypothetical protein
MFLLGRFRPVGKYTPALSTKYDRQAIFHGDFLREDFS